MFVVLLSLFFVLSLSANEVDFLNAQNTKEHKTSSYRFTTVKNVLPLRRSTNFVIKYPVPPTNKATVTFTLSPVADLVGSVLSQAGVKPIDIPFRSTKECGNEWCAFSVDAQTVSINIITNAVVGVYNFSVSVTELGSNTTKVFPQDTKIVLLFNPFSSSDDAYMPEESEREEYVLSEQGAMWLNQYSGPIGWTWDHFDEDVLVVTLDFMNQMRHFDDRSNLIIVSRAFSAFMNANDGGGLLAGKWNEPYTSGKNPGYWTGSGEIFSLYRKNGQAVEYGQCWVFAGVLVSASRTLGIPSRQITNFASAHEEADLGDYRLSIDYFSDKDGKSLGMYGSIWNFHAWSEVWFKRSDVTDGNGWQVVDATPQELSDGLFQLGPAPKTSIKTRNFKNQYDTTFVASEVDSAVRQYVKFNTGKAEHPLRPGFYLAEEELHSCGKSISTKAVGTLDRHDVTSEYKETVASLSTFIKTKITANSNITIDVLEPDSINMGEALTIKFVVACPLCSASNNRTLQLSTTFDMYSYDGHSVAQLKEVFKVLTFVNPTPQSLSVMVTVQEYQKYLADNHVIHSNIFGKVFDGFGRYAGEYYTQVKRYDIITPNIIIKVGNVTETSFTLAMTFKNPLATSLTNSVLTISGAHTEKVSIKLGTVDGGFKMDDVLVNINSQGWPVKHQCFIFAKLFTDEVYFFEGSTIVHNTAFRK